MEQLTAERKQRRRICHILTVLRALEIEIQMQPLQIHTVSWWE